MASLILEPTITAQWQALIQEAEGNTHLKLAEDLESYLVFLLIRFNSHPEIAKSVLALEFLNSHYLVGKQQQDYLRDIGDKCLLFAGLFPGRAETKRVKISYFVEMGQSAYSSLAALTKLKVAELYAEVSEGFVSLMDVLQAVRHLAKQTPPLSPLQAIELWQDTGSQQALAALQHHTKALPFQSNNKKSVTH